MSDEMFPCQACGESVVNPDRTRFTLSASRPAVCPRCGAPHVYDAGIQIDQGWVRRQMEELADLRRRRGEDGLNDSRGEDDGPRSSASGDVERGAAPPRTRGQGATYDTGHDDRRDGHSVGSQH